MTTIKLNLTPMNQLHLKMKRIAGICEDLDHAERYGHVNVHSHGRMIDNMVMELESALAKAKEYQLTVQGRNANDELTTLYDSTGKPVTI